MRNIRPGLALALVVIAVLLGVIPLSHAHDTSAPGLYSSWCAIWYLGGHVVAPPLSIPAAAARPEATVAPPAVPVERVTRAVVFEPASPRAPPQP